MRLFAVLAVVYVALVVLANWLAATYLITVPGTHYIAPAGVLAVGAVLVMRDWIQQLRGILWALALIVVAGLLSLGSGFAFGYGTLVRVALASLAAFAVSEGVFETLIFTPLRKRNLTLAVALSATVGNAVDSLIFLLLAFPAIWTSLYAGNLVGKLEMIAVGVALTAARRTWLPSDST